MDKDTPGLTGLRVYVLADLRPVLLPSLPIPWWDEKKKR
jgi:hypothetical protein